MFKGTRYLCAVTELIWFDVLKERIWVLNILIFIILLNVRTIFIWFQKIYTSILTITPGSHSWLLEDEWPAEQKQKCRELYTRNVESVLVSRSCLSIHFGQVFPLETFHWLILCWLDLGCLSGTHQSHSITPFINCTGERIRTEKKNWV